MGCDHSSVLGFAAEPVEAFRDMGESAIVGGVCSGCGESVLLHVRLDGMVADSRVVTAADVSGPVCSTVPESWGSAVGTLPSGAIDSYLAMKALQNKAGPVVPPSSLGGSQWGSRRRRRRK